MRLMSSRPCFVMARVLRQHLASLGMAVCWCFSNYAVIIASYQKIAGNIDLVGCEASEELRATLTRQELAHERPYRELGFGTGVHFTLPLDPHFGFAASTTSRDLGRTACSVVVTHRMFVVYHENAVG